MKSTTIRLRRHAAALALGLLGAGFAELAAAGCGTYNGPAPLPPHWPHSPADAENGAKPHPGGNGIVGMWKETMVSDGTAYPGVVPNGMTIDFGTTQWHSDGTEFLISGGRAPSTGDVCMGVWEQVGPNTFSLKHVALPYNSSDSNPPVVPAVFVGPSIIKENVTVSRSGNSYEGTFTIDQYATDETTLLEHIGGTVTGIRFTPD